MSTKKELVVMVSGGMDSLVLSDWYPEATLVMVDYGQPYFELEYAARKALFPTRETHLVKIEGIAPIQTGDYYVPARNLMLAICGAHYGNTIYFGALEDDHAKDKTPEAFLAMSRILTDQCKYEVTVDSPLWKYNKAEMVAEYLSRGGSAHRLTLTNSCYEGIDKQCQDCPACFRWSVALRANGIDVFLPGKNVTQYYLGRLHLYEDIRVWSTLKAISTPDSPVIICDIDGVLTNETEGHSYAERSPNLKQVRELNQLAKEGAWIVLYSSRREIDRQVTKEWLRRERVFYHALLLEKPPCSRWIDDQAEVSLSPF